MKMLEYSTEPSVPRFLKVMTLPEGQYALVRQMLDMILQLHNEGLSLVNI
jgi:hypothetical protein